MGYFKPLLFLAILFQSQVSGNPLGSAESLAQLVNAASNVQQTDPVPTVILAKSIEDDDMEDWDDYEERGYDEDHEYFDESEDYEERGFGDHDDLYGDDLFDDESDEASEERGFEHDDAPESEDTQEDDSQEDDSQEDDCDELVEKLRLISALLEDIDNLYSIIKTRLLI